MRTSAVYKEGVEREIKPEDWTSGATAEREVRLGEHGRDAHADAGTRRVDDHELTERHRGVELLEVVEGGQPHGAVSPA
jgi:hypothetical protein